MLDKTYVLGLDKSLIPCINDTKMEKSERKKAKKIQQSTGLPAYVCSMILPHKKSKLPKESFL